MQTCVVLCFGFLEGWRKNHLKKAVKVLHWANEWRTSRAIEDATPASLKMKSTANMNPAGRNITLIGMPGSGKSTLGRLLASRLAHRFVDGDDLLRVKGRSLQEILNQEGEEAFLALETQELQAIEGQKIVIAPGGSCVLSRAAMEHLRRISLVVFLDVPLEVLRGRLKDAPMRGIVGFHGHSLEELNAMRRPLYRRYAHVTVPFPNKNLNAEEAFKVLMQHLQSHMAPLSTADPSL